jgi:hypothetical protein
MEREEGEKKEWRKERNKQESILCLQQTFLVQ